MTAKKTIKVALKTGAAKDDFLSTDATGLSEDLLLASLNVLGNDPGSARLYSLQQNLSGTCHMAQVNTAFSALGAQITINADGTIAYDASNIENSLAHLAEGQLVTDTFVYTVRMGNGALSSALVTLQIDGENDAPTLASIDPVNIVDTVLDDMPVAVTGTLSGRDVDHGARLTYSLAGFTSEDPANHLQIKQTDFGTFTLNTATHEYSFLADPDKIDSIVKDRIEVVNFTVTVTDEHNATASKTLTFNLVGENDTPTIQIGGVTTADIYELASSATGANSAQDKFATGSFVVKDLDLTDTLTVLVTNSSSAPRGELTASIENADAVGNRTVNWSYKYTDAALNSLNSGEPTTESFEIQISDATKTVSQPIDLSLHGADELSFGPGAEIFRITELPSVSTNNSLREVTDSISQSGGTSVSWAADAMNSPNLGNFTASLDSTGQVHWSYSVNEKYLNYLRAEETVTQKFTIILTDGISSLTQPISIELTGTSDANEKNDPVGDGAGNISVSSGNQIARGLGGNDFFFVIGDSQYVYGDDGDDRFEISNTTNSLIRGGNGNDKFNIGNSSSSNEIYGDNGDDLFEFQSLTGQQIWGGPGSDIFRVRATNNMGSSPILNDFNTSSPAAGGDKIDLTGIAGLDWNTVNLSQSSSVADQYLLTAGTGLTKWTIVTIVGTNLTMADLADNLVGYTV